MNPEMFTRYAIFLEKIPGRETTPDSIRAHIEHLKKLDEEKRLVLCGPFTDYAGGMVVVQAQDLAEARAIAEADPFVRDGLRTFEIRTWLLACAENQYLG